jgi:hypothetical protein
LLYFTGTEVNFHCIVSVSIANLAIQRKKYRRTAKDFNEDTIAVYIQNKKGHSFEVTFFVIPLGLPAKQSH